MNWLIHNPIADLPGPAFLGVYLAAIVMTCFAAFRAIRSRDTSGWREPPPVPKDLDPYELAYLRGGSNAVIHTALFSLLRRGYVEVIESKKRFGAAEKKLRQADFPPPIADLTTLERTLFRACEGGVTPAVLFRKGGKVSDLEVYCEPYRERLEAEELVLPGEVKRAGLPTWLAGAGVLLLLAGYKIAVALAKGRTNVGFLITMFPFALLVLAIVVGVAASRRRSKRGEGYFLRLRLAFAGLKAPAGAALVDDGSAVLMVGLFGLATLKGTGDVAFAHLFARATATNGGCGAGCGSGCGGGGGGCGGGGCGGGCGGCGG